MRTTRELMINEVISNNELKEILECAPQGGMRKSNKNNTLALISDKTKLYKDKLINGVYHYTGMGQVGDQKFSGQNANLANSNDIDIEIHFFEVLESKKYTYKGIVELVGEPYTEIQKDRHGDNRIVYVFPIKLKSKDTTFFGEGIKEELEDTKKFLKKLENKKTIDKTEVDRIIKGRIGQGRFRNTLLNKGSKCAICDVSHLDVLKASHIVPWSISTDEERIDHNNGLLLCSNHDALFDKHLISFNTFGKIIISTSINERDLIALNLSKDIKIKMNKAQKAYMKKHAEKCLKK